MNRHVRRLERRIRELEEQLAEQPEPPKGVGIRAISPTGTAADISNSRRADRRTTDPWALYVFELVKDRSAEVRQGLLDRVVKRAESRGLAPAPGVSRGRRTQEFDPSARNLRGLGPKFEREELLSMLRAAAAWAETSYLSWSGFAAWARQEAERPETRFARLPRSEYAFRRVFDNWSGACREAGLECGQAVQEVTEEELLAALQATAEWVGGDVVRFADYRRFIELQARDPESRFGSLPRSRQAFIGRFGSFAAACVRAGVETDRVIDGQVRKSRVTVALLEYSDQELLDALRQAAASRGGKPPTEASFKQWLAHEDTKARLEGRLLTLLRPGGYRERFGSWPDALHRAGLISETERRRLFQRRGISDEAIWETVVAALREFGPEMKRAQYQRFAHKLIEESDDPEVRIPSFEVVARRLGGGNFKAAIKRVWEATAGELERERADVGSDGRDVAARRDATADQPPQRDGAAREGTQRRPEAIEPLERSATAQQAAPSRRNVPGEAGQLVRSRQREGGGGSQAAPSRGAAHGSRTGRTEA